MRQHTLLFLNCLRTLCVVVGHYRTHPEHTPMVPVNGFERSLIFYTDAGTTLHVIRVRHAARDFPNLLT
jgi:plasmid stabilization system protein ParE